jgi:adenylylsulfate kinase
MGTNLTWHPGRVNLEDRVRLLKQRGLVVWLTGLSGSGKSTLAVEVEHALYHMGRLAYRLDGDNIRQGLNSDLGFSASDRDENIRRVAEVASLFQDAGIIVLVAFISPYRRMREFARQRAGQNHFLEVYCRADLEILKTRDVKGLYARAQTGQLVEFTGISSPYEEPLAPELVLDTGQLSIEEATRQITAQILTRVQV